MGLLLALLFFLLGSSDDVAKHKRELEDGAYGNLWDRRDSAKALGSIGTREAAQALLEALPKADPPTREAIVLALASFEDEQVRGFVRDQMPRLPKEGVRADVAWAFRDMEWEGAKDALHSMFRDGSAEVRLEAVRALEVLKDSRLAEAAEDRSPDVVEQALLSAAALKSSVDSKLLEKLIKRSEAPKVQGAVLRYLAAVDPAALESQLPSFVLRTAKPEARIAAADVAASPALLKESIHDADWRVRVAAVASLERLWTKEAVALLVERLMQEDGRLILDIVSALQRMTAKEIGFDPKAWAGWWESAREIFEMPEKPKKKGEAPKVSEAPGRTVTSFFGIPLLSKRPVFIIDASGSMKNEDEQYKGKRKIDVAMEELEKAVQGMPKDAKYSIIVLSTEATAQKVRCPGPQLVPAVTRQKGIEFFRDAWAKLEKVKRGRGDIYDAVLEAQNLPEADTVLLLSDGVPTDGRYLDRDHFLDGLTQEYRHRRICVHAILIGSRGIDEKLMEGSADATGGIFMPRK